MHANQDKIVLLNCGVYLIAGLGTRLDYLTALNIWIDLHNMCSIRSCAIALFHHFHVRGHLLGSNKVGWLSKKRKGEKQCLLALQRRKSNIYGYRATRAWSALKPHCFCELCHKTQVKRPIASEKLLTSTSFSPLYALWGAKFLRGRVPTPAMVETLPTDAMYIRTSLC